MCQIYLAFKFGLLNTHDMKTPNWTKLCSKAKPQMLHIEKDKGRRSWEMFCSFLFWNNFTVSAAYVFMLYNIQVS